MAMTQEAKIHTLNLKVTGLNLDVQRGEINTILEGAEKGLNNSKLKSCRSSIVVTESCPEQKSTLRQKTSSNYRPVTLF